MSELKTIKVAGAIIYENDRILSCQRSYGPYTGYWEFPGGKVEPNEAPTQACRREILEELGIRLSTIQYLDTIEYDYPTFHLSMDCFVCQLLPDQEPQQLEHQDMRWLSREELTSVEWLPADTDFIATLGHHWGQIFAFGDQY